MGNDVHIKFSDMTKEYCFLFLFSFVRSAILEEGEKTLGDTGLLLDGVLVHQEIREKKCILGTIRRSGSLHQKPEKKILENERV